MLGDRYQVLRNGCGLLDGFCNAVGIAVAIIDLVKSSGANICAFNVIIHR